MRVLCPGPILLFHPGEPTTNICGRLRACQVGPGQEKGTLWNSRPPRELVDCPSVRLVAGSTCTPAPRAAGCPGGESAGGPASGSGGCAVPCAQAAQAALAFGRTNMWPLGLGRPAASLEGSTYCGVCPPFSSGLATFTRQPKGHSIVQSLWGLGLVVPGGPFMRWAFLFI